MSASGRPPFSTIATSRRIAGANVSALGSTAARTPARLRAKSVVGAPSLPATYSSTAVALSGSARVISSDVSGCARVLATTAVSVALPSRSASA